MSARIHRFFFPSLTRAFLIRAVITGTLAYVFFSYVCIPFRIQGASMEPTYRDGRFNFCWTPACWFSPLKRYDVVAVRFAGNQIMLLKRVVALPGEVIEFRQGKLWVNEREIPEPYVRYPSDWNLSPRQVEFGSVYIVGDNRSMPIERHYFGQASIPRIVGVPLW